MTIANPIYDTVFKYLMEDERIARTILSALLKQNVVAVKVRPHEYVDDQRDSLSVFRIDFGATVRDENGHENVILIELQKTWLETETLRFRQYLGVQYSSPKNVDTYGYALPLVAVYLLGHKVGDIEEPVLYVNHQSQDYNGNPVTRGLPNAFVDSLTHNSIIVQIPRLHGQINNRLDMVLSIFDQSHRDTDNQHALRIDSNLYKGDDEMNHILHKLTMAAADADIRRRMNVEDEFFSVIEKRDTEIRIKDLKLAEQTVQINEQKTRIDEQKTRIDEQKTQIDEQKTQIDEQKTQIDEQKTQINKQKTQIDEQKTQIDEQKTQLRTSVHLLSSLGQTPEEIASHLNMDIDIVNHFLQQ